MYLLDSNTLFQAKNDYYGFEICPGFWAWLERESRAGKVASIERVEDEITDGDEKDLLRKWIESGNPLAFLSPDTATITAMKDVTRWVMQQDYNEQNRAAFFAKADPLLIAHAKAHDCKVVTHESYVPANSKKVKVPNVCEAMGVEWINTFQMLRRERASFVLPEITIEDCISPSGE